MKIKNLLSAEQGVDFSKKQSLNRQIQNLGSDPSSPVVGQEYYNTGTLKVRIYNGSTWDEMAAGGSGDVSQASNSSGAGKLKVSSGANKVIVDYAGADGLIKSTSGVASQATSGDVLALAPAETAQSLGDLTNGLASKATPVDADMIPLMDSGASNIWKKLSWANLKATLITYLTSLNYLTNASTHTLTNKTFDANGTGNVLSNIETGDFAANIIDNDATLAANSATRLATQQATKGYIDTTVQAMKWREPARLATTGSETYTIAGGAVLVIAGTTVDGVTGAINDVIVIKNAPATTGAGSATNTTQPTNGVYIVTNATTNLTVSRWNQADTATEIKGIIVPVLEGTANADTAWHMITDGAITLNTTPLQFSSFNLSGIPNASETVFGKTKYATNAEALAGTGSNNAVLASQGIFRQTALIGNGSLTTFNVTVTGALTWSVVVKDASTGEIIYPDINALDGSQVSIIFAVAPTTNQYRYHILSSAI